MMKGICCVHHFWAHRIALKHISHTDSQLWTSTSKQKRIHQLVEKCIYFSPLLVVIKPVSLSCCQVRVCEVQLHISLLLSDSAASEVTVSMGLISKNQRPLAYLPVTCCLSSCFDVDPFTSPCSNKYPKSDLCHSILWFIRLIKVLLDISCEEGCIPCRPGMDVYGRLFQH